MMPLSSFARPFRVFAALAALVVLPGAASADLIMTVDFAAKTLSFSGATFTGNPGPSGSFGQVVYGGFGDNSEYIIQSDQFVVSGSNGYVNHGIFTNNSGPISGVRITTNSQNTTSLTGTGIPFNYSAWPAASRSSLQQSDGQVFAVTSGASGFQSLTVSVINVPEPSTLGFAVIAVLAGLVRRQMPRR